MMNITTLICDLDGTLLAPSGGTLVSRRVAEGLIALQERGITLVLASARIFQGVLPLAKQVKMDRYHGYIIAQNGTLGYDVASGKTLFLHAIKREDSFALWQLARSYHLDFGIAQPSYMVASGYGEGFALDRYNCGVDYLLCDTPQRYVKEEIWKCSACGEKALVDQVFDRFRSEVEQLYPYRVVRSTDTFIDVIDRDCDKAGAVRELFDQIGRTMENAAAIGDGNSDAGMIAQCGYGVTLENGSDLCKRYAKRIVSSYEQEGCMELIEELLTQSHS